MKTPLFVWNMRVNLEARNIQIDFLRERPAAGVLLDLPGIRLLELPTLAPKAPLAKTSFQPLSVAVYDSETKETKDSAPPLQPPEISVGSMNDAAEIRMLLETRNRMEFLNDDRTPTKVHAHVARFTAEPTSINVSAMGYATLQIQEIRQIAQWFPFHVKQVVCSFADSQTKRPTSVTAILSRYSEPFEGLYKRHQPQRLQM